MQNVFYFLNKWRYFPGETFKICDKVEKLKEKPTLSQCMTDIWSTFTFKIWLFIFLFWRFFQKLSAICAPTEIRTNPRRWKQPFTFDAISFFTLQSLTVLCLKLHRIFRLNLSVLVPPAHLNCSSEMSLSQQLGAKLNNLVWKKEKFYCAAFRNSQITSTKAVSVHLCIIYL